MEGEVKKLSKIFPSVAPWKDKIPWTHIETQEIPFKLQKKKGFSLVRVVGHWNCLPREAEESPSLEIFKTQMDEVLRNLFLKLFQL